MSFACPACRSEAEIPPLRGVAEAATAWRRLVEFPSLLARPPLEGLPASGELARLWRDSTGVMSHGLSVYSARVASQIYHVAEFSITYIAI